MWAQHAIWPAAPVFFSGGSLQHHLTVPVYELSGDFAESGKGNQKKEAKEEIKLRSWSNNMPGDEFTSTTYKPFSGKRQQIPIPQNPSVCTGHDFKVQY